MDVTTKIPEPTLKWEQSEINGTKIPLFYVEHTINKQKICVAKVELDYVNGNFEDRWRISIFDKAVAIHKGTFGDHEKAIEVAERLLRRTALDLIYKLIPE